MIKAYFPLGEPPQDDVEAAARLLVKYRAAKLTGPEFGEMFFMRVRDPRAVVNRALEIEAGQRRLLERMQSEADVCAIGWDPNGPEPETFEQRIARIRIKLARMKAERREALRLDRVAALLKWEKT